MQLPKIVGTLFMYCLGVFLDLWLNLSPKNIWECLGNIFGVPVGKGHRRRK